MQLPFTGPLIGYYRVINWPNFNTVAQGIARPEKRKRGGRGASQNTQHLSVQLPSHMGALCGAPKTITIVTSEISDHRSP